MRTTVLHIVYVVIIVKFVLQLIRCYIALSISLSFPEVVVLCAFVDTHGDEANQTLTDNPTQQLGPEDRIVVTLRTMRVFKYVE